MERGLEILRSINNMGLLLVPENPKNTEWPDITSTRSTSNPWRVAQICCCFTLIEPTELLQHAKTFGPFALEFDIEALRDLGAISVFYLPCPQQRSDASGQLAFQLVKCVGRIDELLCHLKEVQEDYRSFPLMKNGRVVCELPRDLVSCLTKGYRLTDLQAGLRALSGFLKRADNLESKSLLSYYREREWRLIPGASKRGKPLTRHLTEKEKQSLLKIDEEFFSEIIPFRDGEKPRVDECRVFKKLTGVPILQYIKRLIVPEVAVPMAKAILNDRKHSRRVQALESITPKHCIRSN